MSVMSVKNYNKKAAYANVAYLEECLSGDPRKIQN